MTVGLSISAPVNPRPCPDAHWPPLLYGGAVGGEWMAVSGKAREYPTAMECMMRYISPRQGCQHCPFLPGSLVLPFTLSSTLLSTRYLLWGTTGDHVTRCPVGGGCELPVLERDRLGFQVLSGGHSNTGREAGHAQVLRDLRGM